MTSDLRGFELDGGGDGNGGTHAAGGQKEARDSAAAALDVLAQAFGVVTERGAPGSGTRKRTWAIPVKPGAAPAKSGATGCPPRTSCRLSTSGSGGLSGAGNPSGSGD